jgi:hypothetical protein
MNARTASHLTALRRALLSGALAALAMLLLAAVTTPQPALAASRGEIAWARIVPGVATAGVDRVIDVAPGPGGTLYVLGVYNEPTFTGWTWVARYAADGRKLWVKKYGEAQGIDANCWAMAVDRAGDLVVAGSRRPLASADADMLVLKYTPGGRLVWARSYAGPGADADVATSVCTDAAGNVYAGGFATQAGGTYSAFAVVRWSARGHRDWVTTIESLTPGPGDGATSMVIDGRGATYLTGHVQDSPTTTACLTTKVSATGAVLWKQIFAPGAVFNEGMSIGRRGSVVYVAGRASDDGAAATVFLAKYAAGTGSPSTVSWSAFTQSMFDPLALAVGADGSAWVTSNSAGAGGFSYAALEKFAADPGLSWSWSDPDPAFQTLFYDVVVDGAGRAWAVGNMMDIATMDNNVYAAAFSPGGSEMWRSVWRRSTGQSAAAACACLLGSDGLAAGGWANGPVTARDPLLLRIER